MWANAPEPQIMDTECGKLHGAKLTSKRIAEAKAAATKALEAAEASIQHMPAKRNATLIYRGARVDLAVATLSEELDLRIACLAKWAAREKGLIPPFLCEDSLIPKNMKCPVPDVDQDILKAAKACRTHANKLMDQDAAADADQLKSLLQSRQGFLMQLDKTCIVEITWLLGLIGEGGETRLQEDTLKCLPGHDDSTEMTFAGSLQKLGTLQASPLYRFVSKGAQGQTSAVKEVLVSLTEGKPPAISHAGALSPFMSQVMARLAYFAKEATGTGGKNILFGRDAVALRIKQLDATLKKNPETLDLAKIGRAGMFAWLLDDAGRAVVASCTNSVVERMGAVALASSSSSAQASGKNDASKRGKKQQLADNVNSMFE